MEISSCFAAKVFLTPDSKILRYLYTNYILHITNLYSGQPLGFFILAAVTFFTFSRGIIPAPKYVRCNVMQASLLNVFCSFISSVLPLAPLWIRESILGLFIANFLYLGVSFLIVYSSLLISFGHYPVVPVLSEAARLQVRKVKGT
jgi:hypothetical protein